MKHAYLIMAHNQFDILNKLLLSIDDERNDIYIHFDKKVVEMPNISVKKSKLFILMDRVNVCWGDISVIEAEYKLFEKASKSCYTYYHLLSGVDMPLKNQDTIHNFFAKNVGKEFVGFSQYNYDLEIERKVNYIHQFSKDFKYDNSGIGLIKKIFRAGYLRLQILFRWKRNTNIKFKKGTQWVSITHDFLMELIKNESETMTIYQDTFCADEIYKQTICWNSEFRNHIYDLQNEGIGCQRAIGWKEGELIDWTIEDLDELLASQLLFARKFNVNNMSIVDELFHVINSAKERGKNV